MDRGEETQNTDSQDTIQVQQPGPEVINSRSTQLSTEFIMLINVKMPTIVGILTFMSIINTTSESLKVREVIIFQHFSVHPQLS